MQEGLLALSPPFPNFRCSPLGIVSKKDPSMGCNEVAQARWGFPVPVQFLNHLEWHSSGCPLITLALALFYIF